MGYFKVYLRREYEILLDVLSMATGKSKADLVREALDLLFERYRGVNEAFARVYSVVFRGG